MMTGADAAIACLEAAQTEVIFGYPGATICPFYDSLKQSKIRHILVRQEQNAGHAASGYARMTGRPAVCVVTSGPGATNLITALATAYMDSIPMIAITGQVSTDQLGRDVFQEADITGAAEPFTKHSYLVKNVEDIPRVFAEAFYIAGTGRPGPVLIDLPVDVQKQTLTPTIPYPVNIRGYKPTTKGHPGQIKRVAEAIAAAEKPLICVGGGAFSASGEKDVQQFSTASGIPVVATLMGIGVMPTAHPNYFGMIGIHGKPYANKALSGADLLIIIGARVGDRAVSAPTDVAKKAKIIHIDIDPAEIGKNVGTAVPVVGDVSQVLGQLAELTPKASCDKWLEQLRNWKSQHTPDYGVRTQTVNPKSFVRKLSEAMPDNGVYLADVGQNQIWSANQILMRGGRFLTTGGMGTMGYSIPAAIGAKLACPERQVVAVCGDGSFQMSMNELATAVQNGVGIKVVVFKNHRLGMVREIQKNSYANNQMGVDIGDIPDICALAAAYGIPATRVDCDAQAEAAIESLFSNDKIQLIECTVGGEESSL